MGMTNKNKNPLDLLLSGELVGVQGAVETPCERDRRIVESAGYPRGIDYESLIMAEAEEYWND